MVEIVVAIFVLFFNSLIYYVIFLTPIWSKKMRTKNGNCDECPLLNSQRCSNYLKTTDKSNVSNPDIFVVTDIDLYSTEVVDFLKKKFPNKKYFVVTNIMCDTNNCDKNVVSKKCF